LLFGRLNTTKLITLISRLLINKNIEFELPIKNLVIGPPEYIEVELTQNKRTKVSIEDLDIIENHVWYFCHGYAINSNKVKLHNLIMDYDPKGKSKSVDHIDCNSMNNQISNLRTVSPRIQSLNRGMQNNNKSNHTGVYYNKRNKRWISFWKDEKGNQISTSFSIKKYRNDTKQMAIDAQEEAVSILPHYRLALNLNYYV